jgi:hypothetical protein
LTPPSLCSRASSECGAIAAANRFAGSPQEIDAEETTMHLTTPHYLFLIPVGLALAFLPWFLWSMTKQLSSHRDSSEKQPIISIQVSDRYTMQGLPARPESAPRPVRNLNTETNYGSSSAREYMRTPYAPTLGMRSRARV